MFVLSDIDELVLKYHQNKNRKVKKAIIRQAQPWIKKWALKYKNKGEELDDIIQVANIGILNALERFDPDKGFKFKTFAQKTVMGEIKKYFRDYAWNFKVSRDIKELSVKLSPALEKLTKKLKRTPSMEELADHLDKPETKIAEAMAVKNSYTPASLEAKLNDNDNSSLKSLLGKKDKKMESLLNKTALNQALKTIDKRLRTIIYYRYFHRLSQSEVAKKMAISQMHVSRLERRALNQLKKQLI